MAKDSPVHVALAGLSVSTTSFLFWVIQFPAISSTSNLVLANSIDEKFPGENRMNDPQGNRSNSKRISVGS
jgi:hypothetical protein